MDEPLAREFICHFLVETSLKTSLFLSPFSLVLWKNQKNFKAKDFVIMNEMFFLHASSDLDLICF